MRSFTSLRLLTALMILVLSTAVTVDSPRAEDPAATLESAPRTDHARQVDLEIQDILTGQEARLEALMLLFGDAGNVETARAIRLEIRELLVETEIKILQAQVRHLRRLGQEEAAIRLEASIEVLEHPETRRQALVRPSERIERGGER